MIDKQIELKIIEGQAISGVVYLDTDAIEAEDIYTLLKNRKISGIPIRLADTYYNIRIISYKMNSRYREHEDDTLYRV
jgi:hypothetical protein